MPSMNPTIAVDRDLRNRPGVPMERKPKPFPGTHWPITPQKSRVRAVRHGRPGSMTPVYGTSQPLRGASGVLRRLAYRAPDHKVRHWLLLMFADRVNVAEVRAGRLLRFGLLAGAGLAAGGVATKLLQPPPMSWRQRLFATNCNQASANA